MIAIANATIKCNTNTQLMMPPRPSVTYAHHSSTSLSAINVETRNHAESQNQRLVKAAAAGDTDDSDRRKHSTLCEPLMAAWNSSHYVTYTYRKNLHVYMLSQKICTHITPYGASAKHFTTLSAIDPHFAAPQLLVQNLALPEVAGVALPAKD